MTGDALSIRDEYCGQDQPHGPHAWRQPFSLTSTTIARVLQCAGTSGEAAPGPCFHDPGVVWPRGLQPRCELRAGHAGAHECDRGEYGGKAIWTDEVGRAPGQRPVVTALEEAAHDILTTGPRMSSMGLQAVRLWLLDRASALASESGAPTDG